MNSLKKLAKSISESKVIYVHLPNEEIAKKFLRDAQEQGFLFGDGSKPTEKHISDFFAVHSDLTLNYIGTAGRTAYQCRAENIVRLEYDKFISE